MSLFRCTIDYAAALVSMQNVLYFESSLTAEAVCTYVKDHWVEHIKSCQPPSTVYNEIRAQEIGHLILDPDYYALSVTMPGSRSAELHSDPQLAVCVNLHTGLSGRKRRGRFFLGGVSDADVMDGKLSTDGLNAVNSSVAAGILEVCAVGAPARLQVFSRTIFNGLTDIILDSYKPVTGAQVNPVMSTMRSRKPGG